MPAVVGEIAIFRLYPINQLDAMAGGPFKPGFALSGAVRPSRSLLLPSLFTKSTSFSRVPTLVRALCGDDVSQHSTSPQSPATAVTPAYSSIMIVASTTRNTNLWRLVSACDWAFPLVSCWFKNDPSIVGQVEVNANGCQPDRLPTSVGTDGVHLQLWN